MVDDHRDFGDETGRDLADPLGLDAGIPSDGQRFRTASEYDSIHDVYRRGRWCRIAYRRGGVGRMRFRYYYRGVKMPWLAWAMFS